MKLKTLFYVTFRFDIDFMRDPTNSSTGNTLTLIINQEDMDIRGTIQAGSLKVNTKTLNLAGTIDVRAGGYMTNLGPGKVKVTQGQHSTCRELLILGPGDTGQIKVQVRSLKVNTRPVRNH